MTTFTLTRCDCGNEALDRMDYCEHCTPHDHDDVEARHDFTVNMLCRNCRLIAQDCCDAHSECRPTDKD